MDGLSFKALVDLVSGFGIPGIFFIVWYFSEKSHEKTIAAYREDTLKQQAEHHSQILKMQADFQTQVLRMRDDSDKRMEQLWRMYENNAELVKAWEKIGNGLQDTVVLNTQTMQRMIDVCVNNQFCPNVRMPKDGR